MEDCRRLSPRYLLISIFFQYIVGFFSFLILLCCEGATAGFRASLVPIHASFGLTTFMLAIAACVTGITEKVIFSLGCVLAFTNSIWHCVVTGLLNNGDVNYVFVFVNASFNCRLSHSSKVALLNYPTQQ